MKNKEIIQTLALITQLGLGMLTPVLLCVLLGLFLQKQFGLDWMLPLIILGILAGCRSCWKLLKQQNEGESKDKNKSTNDSSVK